MIIHLVIPGSVDALIGGAALYGVVALLTPHFSSNRRLAVFVLLVVAIFFLVGAVTTVRIG